MKPLGEQDLLMLVMATFLAGRLIERNQKHPVPRGLGYFMPERHWIPAAPTVEPPLPPEDYELLG